MTLNLLEFIIFSGMKKLLGFIFEYSTNLWFYYLILAGTLTFFAQ